MFRSSIIILFLFITRLSYSQTDSLRISVFDSLNSIASIQLVKDSLTIYAWSDSLKIKVQSKFKPDSIHLINKIDSLKSLRLSTEPYSSRLDSLLSSKQSKFKEIDKKQQELSAKTKARVDGWQQAVRTRLDSLGIKGNLPANLPNVNIPGTELKIPDLNLPEMPSLSPGDFGDLNLSPDLSKLNAELPFVSMDGLKGIQDNLSGIGDKISGISDLRNNPMQSIESAASKIDAVSEVQKQAAVLEELKPPANPAEMKEQAMEKAIDHFAGKEEPLNQAMEKVSKYKQKFSSVQSLKDLPKKAPNPMKGKPFIERVVPGVTLQVLKRDNYLLDVAPSVGYRFNRQLTIGIGWNHRVSSGSEGSASQTNVYGPRLYGEYKVFKGISGRLELETMNAYVPQNLTITDHGQREWVPAVLAGMKQEYKIYKNLKGTALILYNFYNPEYKSPYGDRLNARFGFELVLKKKKKETPAKK